MVRPRAPAPAFFRQFTLSFRATRSFVMTLLRASTGLRVAPRLLRYARQANTMALALDPPTLDAETAEFAARTKHVEEFFAQPRFAGITRPYAAAAVASKQGSMPPVPLHSSLLSDKLHALLKRRASEGAPVHTMGAIDPVQMTQMARHQEVLYVSGWAASSVLTTGNNEVGPDLGCVMLKRP